MYHLEKYSQLEIPKPSNLPSLRLTSITMTVDDPSGEVVLRLDCKETLLPPPGDGRRRNGRWLGFIDHDLDPRSHWPTHPLSTERSGSTSWIQGPRRIQAAPEYDYCILSERPPQGGRTLITLLYMIPAHAQHYLLPAVSPRR